MVRLAVNEIPVEVAEGTNLLAAIERAGVQVPTLCHHKALTPYGACRLCVVEVHAPDRAPSVQASCSYPALDGLGVFTHTDRVIRARRIVAELLLARSPDSLAVQRVAAELGVHGTRITPKHDDCIYCGLCVRMCAERMGRAAIGFSGRGPRKTLEPPFGKHNPVCWTCGACDFICPTGKKVSSLTTAARFRPLPNPHNLGLDQRPAVHILYPQAVPNKAAIDPASCVHLRYDDCGICREVCEAGAIRYDQAEQRRQLDVGAVVLSPGYEIFDARLKQELGYGRFANVITALEFERIMSASGPFAGHILRPGDRREPKRIAFIQCVGSRDADRDYCSSVCCMYATKEAILAKEHLGADLACDIFYMDVRAYGKGFEQYFERAQALGVNYIRSRPPAVRELPETGNLVVEYLGEGDRKTAREYDLVVLSVGILPPSAARELARTFEIELDEFGFCRSAPFAPVESSRPGVYVAGPFTEPKDIPETVMQASGAAARVLSLLHQARGSLITPREYPPERIVEGEPPRVGVFVCHCGSNIASVVNVPEVVAYARNLPDVVHAESNLYTCSNDTQQVIKDRIQEHRLNRVVVASCTPRTHEPLFRNTLREAGLNPYLFEMANIRDQCSWVHMHEPEQATAKARDLVRMAVAKARLLEPLQRRSVPVERAALVIGGGLAGMTAALELAGQGVRVYLVEQEPELGGNLRHLHYLLNGGQPQEELRRLVERVRAHDGIEVFTQARIQSLDGSIGSFTTRITTNGDSREVRHGVVILATGAIAYRPTEYLYGQDPRVLTQLELEARLATPGAWAASGKGGPPRTVVMIQCVGSRDAEHPYCSRVCCSEAIKNALRLKQEVPDTHVYVLYRDIRTYGFRERFYTEARRRGVAFLRYDPAQKPEVSPNGKGLRVQVFDQTLQLPVDILADLVVLSAGIVPTPGGEAVAQLLKVPRTSDGFFLEAHLKLRPVDFATDGVFLCGLAHSAKAIDETIVQAQAAAARAATVLARDRIELEANISQVVPENCDGCAYCVGPCPFHAITLIEYMRKGAVKKIIEIDETACKGCGCCQATCPKNGVFVRGFTLAQIAAQAEAAFSEAAVGV